VALSKKALKARKGKKGAKGAGAKTTVQSINAQVEKVHLG